MSIVSDQVRLKERFYPKFFVRKRTSYQNRIIFLLRFARTKCQCPLSCVFFFCFGGWGVQSIFIIHLLSICFDQFVNLRTFVDHWLDLHYNYFCNGKNKVIILLTKT